MTVPNVLMYYSLLTTLVNTKLMFFLNKAKFSVSGNYSFFFLLYLQANNPIYDNIGFQHDEGRPPPYTPQQKLYPSLPQETPSYVVVAPQIINTHYTVTPGTPHITRQTKGTALFVLPSAVMK